MFARHLEGTQTFVWPARNPTHQKFTLEEESLLHLPRTFKPFADIRILPLSPSLRFAFAAIRVTAALTGSQPGHQNSELFTLVNWCFPRTSW